MRKLWIGAAMAALLVTGCQAGTFHGADGTKNQAVVRESGAGDTAVSGNRVNSADAADQVSRSSRPIVITSEPAVSMTNTDDMVTVTGQYPFLRYNGIPELRNCQPGRDVKTDWQRGFLEPGCL